MGQHEATLAQVVKDKWKQLEMEKSTAKAKASHPQGGMKFRDFDTLRTEMTEWIQQPDAMNVGPEYRQAAGIFVLMGLTAWSQLDGCGESDILEWDADAAVKAVMKRAIREANARAQRIRTQKMTYNGPHLHNATWTDRGQQAPAPTSAPPSTASTTAEQL